jgi:hypothetical protein
MSSLLRESNFLEKLTRVGKKKHFQKKRIVRLLYLNEVLTISEINDYMKLVIEFDGTMIAQSSEGRLKAAAVYGQLDEYVLSIYKQIRTTFDPFGTMNPNVKQATDVKTCVSMLNSSYNLNDITKHSPQF